ncbi:MAG: EAL domain-containing protein [Spirochaetota bacterium]
MAEDALVLVADDNRVNRHSIQAILKDSPFTVAEAANGLEALEYARKHHPDLILMDLMMPEMDGLEVTRRLKSDEETARIPILMLTALDDTEDRISAFNAGATGFLNKPFDRLELLAHVYSYVNLSIVNRKYVLSTADPNTGLPNRTAYRDRVRDYTRPWLFLAGMDDIESIRQFYGDPNADALEREYATYLQRLLTESYGSDRELFHVGRGVFAVLCDDAEQTVSRETALEQARELGQLLRSHDVVEHDVQWETDFTLVVSTEGPMVLEQAELGLSEAFRNRQDVVYAPDVADDVYLRMENNLRWLKRIRLALAQDRFVAYYQPIVDNFTGETFKYEALLRMLDDDGAAVSPGKFLSVAKNSKYYGQITRRVFDRAVAAFLDRPEGVAVNLSVLDIESSRTRGHILSTLKEYPDFARRLTLEIVEQEGLEHYDEVKSFIEEVKALGALIALDDFGSGYSNFVRIIDLDVDYVKLDGSIITRLEDEQAMRELVVGLRSYVATNNIELIAEFVETESVRSLLQEMGVRFSQGFCIGRPQPLPDTQYKRSPV